MAPRSIGRRAGVVLFAGMLTGCLSSRVEVGALRPAHVEPLPGLPMTVRVVAQDTNGQVVRFAPAPPPSRGRHRTPPPAEAAAVDPRSDRLLRPRADTYAAGSARVMVWVDLGPTAGVEVHPDRISVEVDGKAVTPNVRWWHACARADECYGSSDPDGSAVPSALPFKVDGVAWIQLYYALPGAPPRELVVHIGGVAQQRRRPMTTEVRFVRVE